MAKYWRRREGMSSNAPAGYTYIVRDDLDGADGEGLDWREQVIDGDQGLGPCYGCGACAVCQEVAGGDDD